ncbi:hypothetical protein FHW85_002084 [Dyella sp. SG609]|nr:hypothetical protein [Dyella sp. SG609]
MAMMIQFYIRIEGVESRLDAIPQDFLGALGGGFVERRGSGRPLTNSRLRYWMSSKVESTFESLAADLIVFLRRVLDLPRVDAELEVTVVVVAACHEDDERPGFYLGAELVRLIGLLGASIDYDVVPYLR